MLILTVLLLVRCVWGTSDSGTQNSTTIPSFWREPTSTLSLDERVAVARQALDSIVPLFNAGTGQIEALEYQQSINVLSALALHDTLTGNKSNQATVTSHLDTVFKQSSPFDVKSVILFIPEYAQAATSSAFYYSSYFFQTESDVSPTMTWALAAIYAHRAYDNQSLLNLSTQVWEQQNKFVVPSQFIQRSQVPGTNVSLAETCDNVTTAGAVMNLNSNTSDSFCHASTIGGFITLSAYLFELTADQKYAAAVELSTVFVKSHMFNGTVVIDRVDMHSCDKVAHEAVTYDSGLFIEGLSVYSNQSDQTNAMWAPFLDQVVQEAVVFSGWTGPDGINFEYERGNRQSGAQIGLRSVFIRGLFEAWSRMDQTSSTARLVESYVIVQYNALLDLASNRSNLYSPLWHGPPATALTPQGQLAALDTLNSAAGLGAPILLSSSTTTSTHLSSSATSSSSPTVAPTAPQSQNKTFGSGFSKVKMLLIVVLSIVMFLLLATSLLSLRRRHRRQSVSGATSTETRILVVPSRQSPNMPQPEHPVVSRPTSIWKTPESLVGEEIDISSVVEERGSIVFSEDVETGRPRTVDIMDPPYPSSMPRLIRQLKEMLAGAPPENIDEPPPYRL